MASSLIIPVLVASVLVGVISGADDDEASRRGPVTETAADTTDCAGIPMPFSSRRSLPNGSMRVSDGSRNVTEFPMYGLKTWEGCDLTIGGRPAKPQVICFCLSRCRFSQRALASLDCLADLPEYAGVDFIAICIDRPWGPHATECWESLDAFLVPRLRLPICLVADESLARSFLVSSVPTVFVIAAGGCPRLYLNGWSSDAETRLTDALDEVVADMAVDAPSGDAEEESRDEGTSNGQPRGEVRE